MELFAYRFTPLANNHARDWSKLEPQPTASVTAHHKSEKTCDVCTRMSWVGREIPRSKVMTSYILQYILLRCQFLIITTVHTILHFPPLTLLSLHGKGPPTLNTLLVAHQISRKTIITANKRENENNKTKNCHIQVDHRSPTRPEAASIHNNHGPSASPRRKRRLLQIVILRDLTITQPT